ncbi:MAG: tetratricopeptide repeat protein [Thermodesulfovibrionales bacterium]
MKKLGIAVVISVFMFACQNKDASKPQYQFPSGGGATPSGPVGGGPIQGTPLQNQDEQKMLKEAAAKDPKNVQVWIRLGNLAMDNGRFQEAIDAYEEALKLDPKNVDVRVDLGTCYRSAGKPDIAVKEYRKAVELNPNHLLVHKNLGVVFAYDLRDKAQAIKEFEKVLQIAPNAPDSVQIQQEIQKLKSSK